MEETRNPRHSPYVLRCHQPYHAEMLAHLIEVHFSRQGVSAAVFEEEYVEASVPNSLMVEFLEWTNDRAIVHNYANGKCLTRATLAFVVAVKDADAAARKERAFH